MIAHPENQLTLKSQNTKVQLGNVYVADSANDRIQKFTGSGTYLDQWGNFGPNEGEFNEPSAVEFEPSGIVYVADEDNDRIQKFTTSGVYLDQWSARAPVVEGYPYGFETGIDWGDAGESGEGLSFHNLG